MVARGKRWRLEPGYWACSCGAQVAVRTNERSGESLMYRHDAPGGGTCPEWTWQESVERTRKICEAAGVTP